MNGNKHSSFFILLLLLVAGIQAEIFSGSVVDKETENGLAGVLVSLLNSIETASTDKDGQFTLNAEIPVTTRRVRFNKNNILQWNNTAHAFNLSLAPEVTSLLISSLKGERLFFTDLTGGAR